MEFTEKLYLATLKLFVSNLYNILFTLVVTISVRFFEYFEVLQLIFSVCMSNNKCLDL